MSSPTARARPRRATVTPGLLPWRVVDYILRLTPAHYAVCSCWPLHCHVEVVIAAWRWLTRARE